MAGNRKKKGTPKAYKGYMQFPLMGVEDYATFLRMCNYYGDFVYTEKRVRIFSRPRKYRCEIWLKIRDKSEYEIVELSMPYNKIGKEELGRILFKFATKNIRELKALNEQVDEWNSFIKVMLL